MTCHPESPTGQSALDLAYADRHHGQDANLAAATKPHRDDRERAETALATLARSGAAFTADGVHRLIKHDDPTPYNANVVSSLIGIWAKRGWIKREPGGMVASTRRSRHASRNARWRGVRAQIDGLAA